MSNDLVNSHVDLSYFLSFVHFVFLVVQFFCA